MLIRSLKEVSDRGGYKELLLSSIEHLPLLRNLVLK